MSDLSIRHQIQEVVQAQQLRPNEFQLVHHHHYEGILASIIQTFTVLGKNGATVSRWWESFKGTTCSTQVDNAFSLLKELVPHEEQVWFVAEDWGRTKRSGNFWLYEGRIQAIELVLGEMFRFEYYVVSKKFEWLLCENSHNFLIGVGQPMVDRMQRLMSSLPA